MTKTIDPRVTLDRDLKALQNDLLRVGKMLDSAIERAFRALTDQDAKLAKDVIEDDANLNNLRFQIEENCLKLIATQQPAAGDLRAIIAAMNMINDLERMGDHAAGIAKTVLRIEDLGKLELPSALHEMYEIIRTMLRKVMQAYSAQDTDLANEVATQDDLIDTHYRELYRELLERMANDPQATHFGVYLLYAGHNLERIADRITNLAERVNFLASGRMEELNPEPDETGFN